MPRDGRQWLRLAPLPLRRRWTGSGCQRRDRRDVPSPFRHRAWRRPGWPRAAATIVAGQSALTGVKLCCNLPRSCCSARYVLTAGTSERLPDQSTNLLVLSSVKALATLRWLQGPPRPGLEFKAVPVCNCSVLPFDATAHRVGGVGSLRSRLCKASDLSPAFSRTRAVAGIAALQTAKPSFTQGNPHDARRRSQSPLG